ncbi:ATP-dependent RNA helicase DHX29-like [Argonauta hians]
MGKKKIKDQEKVTKSYKFTKSDHIDNSDDTTSKIQLNANMEKRLITMILDWKKSKKLVKDVSERMTTKRLTDVYTCLARAGFKHAQIESAMRNTLIYGGDLIDALDWLCLNISNDDLPSEFSEALKMEEIKRRPGFKEELVDKSNISSTFHTIEKPDRIKSSGHQDSKLPKDDAKMKNWILQYAEEGSDSDTEDNDANIDPNLKYKTLSSCLDSTIVLADQAKKSGNKEQQRECSKKIRQMRLDMDELATHPDFDRKLAGISLLVPVKPEPKTTKAKSAKVLDLSTDSTQSSASAGTNKSLAKSGVASGVSKSAPTLKTEKSNKKADDGILGLDMLEKMVEGEASKPKPAEKKKAPAPVSRSFEYTRQQWTGKSPKQFLNDWTSKNLPKSEFARYERIQVKNCFKCKSSITKKDGSILCVTPDVMCSSVKEAEHVGSTLLLYHLCKGQPIYQLLPPPYRDLWLEWMEAERISKQKAQEINNKPRDTLVTKLLKELKLAPTLPKSKPVKTSCENKNDDDDGVCDDWFMADDDDFEGYEEKPTEQKSVRKPKVNGIKEKFLKKIKSEKYNEILEQRQSLPVFAYKGEILAQIDRSKVVVIAGETGSGKSTQIPHFLLEDRILCGEYCNILCTEPRRISAVSLANRVSEELGDNPPGSADSFCGYRIRFESRCSPATCLAYCTTGVVLRQLHSDPTFKNVTHIIVDEVHERTVQSDFLLIILKRLLANRDDLKVILMSATIDCNRISDYFNHCPIIKIPGRTFPVDIFYLEDVIEMNDYVLEEDSPYCIPVSMLRDEQKTSVEVTGAGGIKHKSDVYWSKEDIIDTSGLDRDKYSKRTRLTVTRMKPHKINLELILHLLNYITDSGEIADGAILIFLPGLANIQELYELLQSDRKFANPRQFKVLALHSVLSSEDQSAAFVSPPKGIRKIVLSTNIAETGVTIPDVVYVIDAGKVKENRYVESSRMNALEEVFVSKASAKQRSGRAGRVRNGICYRLYTKDNYLKFREFTVPELLRVALEELCLHIMKCNLGKPEEFLRLALDPPQSQSVSRAMIVLDEVGACEDELLTPLGYHLAALPVHVSIGKMLIFGAMFGCLEPAAVIAAAMSGKSPFVVPLEKKSEANMAKQNLAIACSDHLTIYNAYSRWKTACKAGFQAENAFCMQNYLKRKSLIEIEKVKTDLIKLIKSIGFLSSRDEKLLTNPNSVEAIHLNPKSCAVIKAVIVAGLYPNVTKVCSAKDPDGTSRICGATTPQGHAYIHPSSVNRTLQAQGYAIYQEKVKLSQVYLRDCTLISPFPLLLFGHNVVVQHIQQTVSIDKWIIFKSRARTAVIFKELRNLLNELLKQKLDDPKADFYQDKSLLSVIDLLQADIC